MHTQNYNIRFKKFLIFFFIFKMREKVFFIVFDCTKRRCSQIEPQLKVEIKDWPEAP